jgi:Xaa-Pro aminopeptidase
MTRLDDVLDLMTRDQIDVLILGREAHVRTVAGTTRLWLAGTRPFAPGCVVVRDTRAVHVLSNSDDGVPAEIPSDRLFGITWNPEKLLGALLAIPGVREARRIGVDGMTPLMHTMLTGTVPGVEFVDAGALFAELWARPTHEQRVGVEAAAAVAEAGLAAMRDALAPESLPRALRGVCAAAFAVHGVTTPAFEAVATPFDLRTSTWLAPDRAFVEGDAVVLRAGALRDGWEASLARTFSVGASGIPAVDPRNWDVTLECCLPGVSVGALRRRDAIVYGVGRGVEPWADDLELLPGMMLSLEVSDTDALRQDVVRITDDGPVVVTHFA